MEPPKPSVRPQSRPPLFEPIDVLGGRRPTIMTRDDYGRLATSVARTEINAVAQALATQVQQAVAAGLTQSVSRHLAAHQHEINSVHVMFAALLDVLERKGLINRAEVTERAKQIMEELQASSNELKKQEAAKEAAAKAAAPAPAAEVTSPPPVVASTPPVEGAPA